MRSDDEPIHTQAWVNEVANGYKNSLFATAKLLLGYKDVNVQTHGRIVDCLESDSTRKLIVCPRGALKSSLGVVAYSIWILLRNPNARILIDSEIYTNSKNFIREIKAHLETERLTQVFGQFKSDSNWTEGSITIRQRTHPYKESSITASGVGAVKVGQHFDYIICDDLNSNKNSLTDEGRKKVIAHYRLNLSILEPTGTMVVIGTRYASDDILGFILSNECGIDAFNPDFIIGATDERNDNQGLLDDSGVFDGER